jgi:uncharacterized membrane protein
MSRTNKKEVKSFYGNDRLNKGYVEEQVEITGVEKAPTSPVSRKYDNLLPPIEVITEYEDIYPGTFEKIIKMAEAEQKQKFLMDQAASIAYEKSRRLGALFGMFTAALICVTTYKLAEKDLVTGLIFALAGFGAVFGLSFASMFRRPSHENRNRHHHNRNRNERSDRSERPEKAERPERAENSSEVKESNNHKPRRHFNNKRRRTY